MSSHFHIYAAGPDLDASAAELRGRIESFAAAYDGRVRVVDQPNKDGGAADLPERNLGVSFEMEALSDDEKRDLLLLFQNLSVEFARDFIVGGAFLQNRSEDLVSVSAGESLEAAFDLLLASEIRS